LCKKKIRNSSKLKNSDEKAVFEKVKIPEEMKEKLMAEIKRRLTPKATKVRADFELTCYSFDGIDTIKEVLKAGQKKSLETSEIKANSMLLW